MAAGAQWRQSHRLDLVPGHGIDFSMGLAPGPVGDFVATALPQP